MIQLTNGYAIDADQYQYIVGKPYTYIDSKTKKEATSLTQASYYPTLERALNSICERLKRDVFSKSNGTLGEAVKSCQSVTRAFAEELHELFGDAVEVIVHEPERAKEQIMEAKDGSKLHPSA